MCVESCFGDSTSVTDGKLALDSLVPHDVSRDSGEVGAIALPKTSCEGDVPETEACLTDCVNSSKKWWSNQLLPVLVGLHLKSNRLFGRYLSL